MVTLKAFTKDYIMAITAANYFAHLDTDLDTKAMAADAESLYNKIKDLPIDTTEPSTHAIIYSTVKQHLESVYGDRDTEAEKLAFISAKAQLSAVVWYHFIPE